MVGEVGIDGTSRALFVTIKGLCSLFIKHLLQMGCLTPLLRFSTTQDVNVLPHLVQHMRRTDCTILSIVASHRKSPQTTRSLRSLSMQTIGIYGRRSGNLCNVRRVGLLHSSHHTSVTRNLFCVCPFSGAGCRTRLLVVRFWAYHRTFAPDEDLCFSTSNRATSSSHETTRHDANYAY
ncbi:hypothetical protein NEOLEDRAFT_987315 [Neolentinus lepideus HHB14362 ss-1]|uniref:Uncharacterized protein n=1 Tax=Neolentinus lepideus HHB14362 ss-1 TaxID=1314782 RepID=A0A165N5M5_9AGAM|nr:hypothetical protein NEOLEDRAFT_987315 [Neolentinus lepideus HHB14362 ss-1]